MKLDITIMISVIGVVLSVSTFLLGRLSHNKAAGKDEGVLLAEVRQIGDDVRGIKSDISVMRTEQSDMRDRLTRLETRVDLYHGGDKA